MNNKKGFILSTYVYMLLVFFLLLLTTMLAVMNNTKLLSNKLKEQTNNIAGLVDKDFSFVLLGDRDMIIRKGEEYIEPGFKIQTTKKKDLSDIVKITGNVEVNSPNTYKLTYSATYNGITKKLIRNVTVLDNIASSYITWLYEHERNENGLIKDDTADQNIRYAGATADVKNKVYFNCAETDGTNAYGSENYNYESSCEIWRIIGVFDTKSTDSETEDAVPRIKIVRDAVLSTKKEWDTTADGVTYINQWGETTLASDDTTPYNGASLKQYLNGDYYNSLTSIAKGQIGTALWYTGALTKDTASGVYEDERSNATGTGTTVNYTTKWAGMIGLIYASDFGYAGTNCGSYTIYDYDNASSCGKTSNWLTPSIGTYWTISPYASGSSHAWGVDSGGYAPGGVVDLRSGVRPAIYLSSDVQIIGGDGSDIPYKLAI